MSDSYSLVTQFKGYINKADITNVGPEYLVPPSQNMIISDAEKVAVRGGYSLLGTADPALTPVLSSFDWNTSTNTELNLKKYSTTLAFYYSSAWRVLDTANLFTATAKLNFRPWWSASEAKDLLIFVDGTPNLYMWSGGITTYASSTSNTITKEGTTTWAQTRFLLAGTRKFKIGAIEYTYTGGEGTTTVTGVSPDPTAGGHAVGDLIVQSIVVTANTPGSAVNNSIIEVNRNQLYVADYNIRDVYLSKNSSYVDFSFSTPRLPGEGALMTLDSPAVGFTVQEEDTYISSNKNDWYQIKFNLSADLTKEKFDVKKLKSGTGQAAYSQSSISKAKNQVVFFSNEKVIDTLGRVENINTPQSHALSDTIKTELTGYNLTIEPDSIFFQNRTYITFPSEGKVLIYDWERGYWMPPQILPVRKWAIIGGALHGHSNATPDTYILFTGTNDNGFAIQPIAAFSYRNYGKRALKKEFDEWYTEGYISSNTILNLTLNLDYTGSTQILSKDIAGDDDDILFSNSADSSLGKNPLGSLPLGSTTDQVSNLAKFRINHAFKKRGFYEIQPVYSTTSVDAQWELLANGPNIALSTVGTQELQA